MKRKYGDCYYCGGQVTEKRVTVDFRRKGALTVIEDVPAGFCGQCGEKYFTGKASKQLDKLAESRHEAATISVPVRHFRKTASG
jgi:YgiT-type zinc finger domain-containing protein